VGCGPSMRCEQQAGRQQALSISDQRSQGMRLDMVSKRHRASWGAELMLEQGGGFQAAAICAPLLLAASRKHSNALLTLCGPATHCWCC
jgi:hypothetical protein